MLGVIDGVVKEPPSKDEVERARTRLLKNIDLETQQFREGRNRSERMGSPWATGG